MNSPRISLSYTLKTWNCLKEFVWSRSSVGNRFVPNGIGPKVNQDVQHGHFWDVLEDVLEDVFDI